jgi:hypothetical protein
MAIEIILSSASDSGFTIIYTTKFCYVRDQGLMSKLRKRGSKWADLTATIEQARLADADGGLASAGMRD